MSDSPAYYGEGPEALVVSLAIKGDRAAFAELVRRRQSWIRNVMRRCAGDTILADDLSQQVFLQAWRRIRQLKDVGKFGAWLKKLAINEWLQYRRKSDPLRHADGDEGLAEKQTRDAGMAMDLDAALAELSGPQSLCVVLSYYERMSHPEIAELTGMQLGTVKSHIRRGSAHLRELLSAYREPMTEEEET